MSETLSLTPVEFANIYEAWNNYETTKFRTAWEQQRFTAYCSVMPHLKQSITPQEWMPFDWEVQAKQLAVERVDFDKLERGFQDD